MTIEIDIPETLAQEIQTLPRERVNNFAVAGIRQGVAQTREEKPAEVRAAILADLFRQAEELGATLPPVSERQNSERQDPKEIVRDAILEKYRKQGFNL